MKDKVIFLALILSFQGIFCMGGPGATQSSQEKMTPGVEIEAESIQLPPEIWEKIVFTDLQSTTPAEIKTIKDFQIFLKKLSDPLIASQKTYLLLSLLKKFQPKSPRELLFFLQLLALSESVFTEKDFLFQILIPLTKTNFTVTQSNNFKELDELLKEKFPWIRQLKNIIAKIDKAYFLYGHDSGLPTLFYIERLGNSVQDFFDAGTAPKIKNDYLNLAGRNINSLNGLEHYNLEEIVELDLSRNKIKNLPPELLEQLINVETLFLNNNQIAQLDPQLFKKMKKLITLNFTVNKIKDIPLGLFDNLNNLKKLSLEWNQIKKLSKKQLKGLIKLTRLMLDDVKLSNKLKQFLKQHDIEVYKDGIFQDL